VAEVEGLSVLDARSALALALERERGRYNARVAQARRGAPLDLPRLARALAEDVAPAIDAVAAAAAGRVDAVTEALFDLCVDLVARGLVGPGAEARHPELQAAWRELLPRLARHLAEAPRQVAAAITNAALRLEAMPGVRPAEWRAWLGELADPCPDAAALLACGQVLAWRAGAAHWRDSALRAWDALPAPLAVASLGLPPGGVTDREALRRAMAADPFAPPGAKTGRPRLRLLGPVGGFRGFGGPFLAPPRLLSDGERLWAVDGQDGYALHADCFGRTVVRAPSPPARSARGAEVRLEDDGTLAVGDLRARFPELAGAEAAIAAGPLIAVLPPHSHRVVLLARTAGEGAGA
jgi:hypothetical protein